MEASKSGWSPLEPERRNRRPAPLVAFVAAMGVLVAAAPALAQLEVTPITWDIVGLDHNRPATSGPYLFPVGASVCNTTGAPIGPVTVDMVWGNLDTSYIITRPGSLDSLDFSSIPANSCVDAYYEIEIVNRNLSPFGQSRPYTIEATAPGPITASTPAGRQIYIEQLVSQNRNTTTQIRYCDPLAGGDCDPNPGGTGWVILGAGGSMNLLIGNSYFIELTSETATAYEELSSFITLSNTIFQVLSVATTYTDNTAPISRVPQPNPALWGDGCLWDSDPASTNYNSCLSTGKVGGTVVTLYEIRIIASGGASVTLTALHYDRSGSSFHYNTDFTNSPGEITILDPADSSIAKRFVPSEIAINETSILRFTITNPNPVTTSGYNFVDNLPAGVVIDNPANASSTCGGTITAVPGTSTISFVDGVIGPSATCTILVDVTSASANTYNNDSENLFIDAIDTGDDATATLIVTATPPPPLLCNPEDIAAWDAFDAATTPTPTLDPGNRASATTGAGLSFSTSNAGGDSQWHAQTGTLRTLAAARTDGAYYEFQLDTTGIEDITFSLRAYRQNGQAPDTATVDYGPLGDPLVEAVTVVVPEQNNKPLAANLTFSALNENLNPSGVTVFRVYAYNDSGNSPFRLDDVLFNGVVLANCTTNGTPPTPPTLAKSFSPPSVRVDEVSTLTFTITNPNVATELNEITFRDEFPAGMEVVGGTFVNNCNVDSTWAIDGTPDIVLFENGRLAGGASCTLSVDVTSTTIGDNLNLSDPVDSRETLAGNSAQDTLEVLPPPTVPSIAKSFSPNPLLITGGTGQSVLTFQITNNDSALAINSVAFTDTLPLVGGVQMTAVGTIPLSSSGCGSPSFTYNAGTFTLTFTGGTIAAGATCVISVTTEVTGVNTAGGPVAFPNQSGTVSHVFNGTTYVGNDAESTLTVDEPIPGVTILKEVGVSNDPDDGWYEYVVVPPGTSLYYKLTIENTGEIALNPVTVTDPNVDVSGCTWTTPLPVADNLDDDHIDFCIVGPVSALAGTHVNTATVTGTFGPGPGDTVTDTSSATYLGEFPTAVDIGKVELGVVSVNDFLGEIGAAEMSTGDLERLLQWWDGSDKRVSAGESRVALLRALRRYLDPDRDGAVVVFRWETLEERGTIGFYVERLTESGWERVSSRMLPGLIASPLGAEYQVADPGAGTAGRQTYRLIEVEATGTTREYGPFELGSAGGGR